MVWSGLVLSAPKRGRPTPMRTSGLPSGSLSFARTLTVTGVFINVVAASSTASGVPSCAVTVTLTWPVANPPWPSLMV